MFLKRFINKWTLTNPLIIEIYLRGTENLLQKNARMRKSFLKLKSVHFIFLNFTVLNDVGDIIQFI
jgi:hypothetical protein